MGSKGYRYVYIYIYTYLYSYGLGFTQGPQGFQIVSFKAQVYTLYKLHGPFGQVGCTGFFCKLEVALKGVIWVMVRLHRI